MLIAPPRPAWKPMCLSSGAAWREHGQSEQVDEAEFLQSGWLGVFRRDSAWGEWPGDPR
jgi:hypothetical protein